MENERVIVPGQPLAGDIYLGITQVVSGPYACGLLRAAGARIIKIENPSTGGDESREMHPRGPDGTSLFFESLNGGVESIMLDLGSPAGKRIFHDLVKQPNVKGVLHNMRADLVGRYGLDYPSLAPIKPSIVCAGISAFGREGPWSKYPGFDHLVQALVGIMELNGRPGDPPVKGVISFTDILTGSIAAFGMMAGVREAEKTGRGCDVDLSLLDSAISSLIYLGMGQWNGIYEPVRLAFSAHQFVTPSQIVQVKDGWMWVMCQKDHWWHALLDVMKESGLSDEAYQELRDNPIFQTMEGRREHMETCMGYLWPTFKRHTLYHWQQALLGKVPTAPVQELRDVPNHPQVVARQCIVPGEAAWGAAYKSGAPFRFDGHIASQPASPGPDAHRYKILKGDLGYSDEQIARDEAEGAFSKRRT